MRVFLTGGTGFIGRHLADGLAGHELYLFRRGEPVTVLNRFVPDVIIHAAGEIRREDRMVGSNVELTCALLDAARDVDYRSFVYVGSSSEYGRCRGPITEDQPIRPTNRYEATKGAGSLLCLAEAAQGRPVAVVRPFSVYGPRQGRGCFIPTIYRCWRDGTELRFAPGAHDWIHVSDVVRGVMLVALSDPQKLRGQTVNLGTGVQYSNEEVVELFAMEAGPVTVRRVGAMRPYDSDSWVADPTFAHAVFGFRPAIDLRQGIRSYVAEPD